MRAINQSINSDPNRIFIQYIYTDHFYFNLFSYWYHHITTTFPVFSSTVYLLHSSAFTILGTPSSGSLP